MTVSLFNYLDQPVKLSSGVQSHVKIDCDALTDEDIASLAMMIKMVVGPYSRVEGVPTGGDRLAEELRKSVVITAGRLLIVDDVLTSGGSMERKRAGRNAMGAVIFARGACPHWVTPLFWMSRYVGWNY